MRVDQLIISSNAIISGNIYCSGNVSGNISCNTVNTQYFILHSPTKVWSVWVDDSGNVNTTEV